MEPEAKFYTHLCDVVSDIKTCIFQGNTHVKLLTEESSSRFIDLFSFLHFINPQGLWVLLPCCLWHPFPLLFSLMPRSWGIHNSPTCPVHGPSGGCLSQSTLTTLPDSNRHSSDLAYKFSESDTQGSTCPKQPCHPGTNTGIQDTS